MLAELIASWFVKAHPAARRLGLVYEHIAIGARHRRVRASWAPHLEASRAAVMEGTSRCSQFRCAVVIGAGDCLDVPVEELAAKFQHVVLADVAVGPVARRYAKKFSGRVHCVAWDATGALNRIAAAKATLDRRAAEKIFSEADAGPPPIPAEACHLLGDKNAGNAAGEKARPEPDFIVSANCVSQLGLVPGHSLPATDEDEDLPDRCAIVAAKRHLMWLAMRPPETVRVVLADAERLNIAKDGRVLMRENLHERFGLRRPDRRWRWDLAPIPEWDPEYHRVHEVGAWFSGGGAKRG